MRHVIRKQVIELIIGGAVDPFLVQQKIRQYYYNYILHQLEKAFDNISDGNSMIHLDRLEIDLGEITWNNQDIDIPNLQEVLQRKMENILLEKTRQFPKDNNKDEIGLIKEPISLSAGRQWIYYMKWGILPWNLELIDEEWKTLVLEGVATDYKLVSDLKSELVTNRNFLERIVRGNSTAFLVGILESVTARSQKELSQLIREIIQIVEQHPGKKNLAAELQPEKVSFGIWREMFVKAASNSGSMDAMEVAEIWITRLIESNEWEAGILKQLQNTLPLLGNLLEKIIREKSNDASFTSKELDSKNKFKDLDLLHDEDLKTKRTFDDAVVDEDQLNNNRDATSSNIPDSQGIGENNNAGSYSVDEHPQILEEGVYVKHAGLILLNPFFRYLFQKRELLSGNKFNSKAAQEKSVLLLHYIATGETSGDEYLLAVPKLIAGWPLEIPLSGEEKLDEDDLKEAVEMIDAAIEQWTILKNTSVDGLREGFLQRNGKVVTKNDEICFIIEGNAIDILLDHLPWNLSIIKLPWRNELWRVEWR